MSGTGRGWLGVFAPPTSAISIESSAALELSVNRFDRVIAVRGTDETGCALAQSLQVDHMPYLNALQAVQDCTAAQKQVHCYMTDADTLDAARESNLPLGKYRMLLTLQALDPSLTADDVRGLSMPELRQMEQTLSGTDSTGQTSGQGAQSGGNGQNGNGQGNGARYGQAGS